ncbi:MAG TPA: SURF1 family protein [Actinomycetes bacterium]|nr:SURF1 family protein [Actinomycetes bacterium]
MHRTLLTRRWLGLLVLCLLLATVCVRLGFWQLHRFEDHRAANQRVTQQISADPVPLQTLLPVGRSVGPAQEWRRVTASGEYDVTRQLLVRQRPLNGANGYHVLTPLVLADGSALIIDRGWVPAGASATTSPAVPAPPDGQVTVTARLRPSETGPLQQAGLPPGQIRRIAVAEIAADLPYPVADGYAELVGQTPAPAQELSSLPLEQKSTALNLAYAVQWWLFAAIIVGGWYFLGRREALDEQARRGADLDPAQTAVGG